MLHDLSFCVQTILHPPQAAGNWILTSVLDIHHVAGWKERVSTTESLVDGGVRPRSSKAHGMTSLA